jgi:hypothetical protein
MPYVDIVICVGSLPILETWAPIYRGQERMVRDRLRVSESSPYVYFRYTSCLTDCTFKFIRRPISPILSPSYWTFVELTLVTPTSCLVSYSQHTVATRLLELYCLGVEEGELNLPSLRVQAPLYRRGAWLQFRWAAGSSVAAVLTWPRCPLALCLMLATL